MSERVVVGERGCVVKGCVVQVRDVWDDKGCVSQCVSDRVCD